MTDISEAERLAFITREQVALIVEEAKIAELDARALVRTAPGNDRVWRLQSLPFMKQFVGTLGQWGLWSTGACQRKFHFLSRPKEAGSHRDCQPLRPATCPRISV